MSKLTADEIRRSYLDFFVERGHTLVSSAPLAPENDPTLLFSGAGMNQFKDLFAGRGAKPYPTATSAQKCLRTGDLEQVGRTTYHHTFFEMLGNFSFGDYFKREAIHWAWEYLTAVVGIDPARLSATVYLDDDEAYGIWRDEIGLPADRVTRLGAKSNFWPANAPLDGPNGVCGPCSEIFFDYGEHLSCGPGCAKEDCDCPRYCEVWNLVFTQFLRTGENRLEPLPQKNIDTGMGFERLVAVLRGTISTFQTELFTPIIRRVSEISGVPYEFATDDGIRMRRIADHLRAAVFLLAEGLKPGRDGREFVLRRVIRRAVRDGIGLGIERPFAADLVGVVVGVMGGAYPELAAAPDEIRRLLAREEERFRSTYHQGMNALVEATLTLKRSGGTELPGAAAFKLHDERGFPVDLTEDYLREEGLTLDRPGFEQAMEDRRRQSQAGSAMEADIFARGPLAEVRAESGGTEFTGYERTADRGRVVALIVGDRRVPEAEEGDDLVLVTDRSPFYAESGGQVGDAGTAEGPSGRMTIVDTKGVEGVVAMSGRLVTGVLRVGDDVDLAVDVDRRDAIRRNHTATHLLHKALRSHLGDTVTQAGSLVAPDRLRFDFHHDTGLTPKQARDIEAEVNSEILKNLPVTTALSTPEAARAAGAMALFGEKYGDRVRVVCVADYSMELCGGTHCRATGEIGLMRLVSEAAIGAGIRRIEAVTGEGAFDAMRRERAILGELTSALKSRPEDLAGRVAALREEIRALSKRLDEALTSGAAEGPAEERADLPNGVIAVLRNYDGPYEMKHLLAGVDEVREKAGGAPVVALFRAASGDGGILVTGASKAAVDSGFDSGKAVQIVAKVLGGGGGGRPDLGRGKGSDFGAWEEARTAFLRFAAGER